MLRPLLRRRQRPCPGEAEKQQHRQGEGEGQGDEEEVGWNVWSSPVVRSVSSKSLRVLRHGSFFAGTPIPLELFFFKKALSLFWSQMFKLLPGELVEAAVFFLFKAK